MKSTTQDSARHTAITLVVVALFVAAVFGLCELALHLAKPYLPIHKPGRGAMLELQR